MNSMSPVDQSEVPLVAVEISKKATSFFKGNLVGVLLYGSSRENSEYWDLDIMIILESNDLKLTNLEVLKQVQRDFSNHTLDLQLVYRDEIKNPNTFSLDAHGAFFSQILKRAIVLSGENPFTHTLVDKKIFIISIVTRIQRYVFQARQEYIGNGRHNKDKNPSYHRKHVLRVMFDILFMNNQWIETQEIVPLFIKTFPSLLNTFELAMLDSGSDSVDDYMILYEKLYSLALEESAKLLEK